MADKPKRWCSRCRVAHSDDCPRRQQGWAKRQAGKTTTQRGYGWSWEKAKRRVQRRDDYLCQPCLHAGRVTPSAEVDHIIPRFEEGSDGDENLQAICVPCHKMKTKQESLRAVKGRGG